MLLGNERQQVEQRAPKGSVSGDTLANPFVIE
jgi:hypothetical protein